MFIERVRVAKRRDKPSKQQQVSTANVALLGGHAVQSGLDKVTHWQDARLHEGQTDQLGVQSAQGRERLVGYFRLAIVDSLPDVGGFLGDFGKQGVAQIAHFLGKT